jgi:hypothetical protein
MASSPDTPYAPPKRRVQFSLRTLGLLVVVAGVALGIWRWATREQRAIAALERLGGVVEYLKDDKGPFRGVYVRGGDAGLALLPRIKDVRIVFVEATGVTDAGLAPLAELRQLEDLSLHNCQITDAGLVHLAGLDLITLGLDHTLVSDAGLVHLAKMSRLEVLDLSGDSGIHDAGLRHMAGHKKLQVIDLDGTAVTDDGVERLRTDIEGIAIER